MTDLEIRRALLDSRLLTMRELIDRNSQTGMLPVLQEVGRLQVDARKCSDENFPELVERYGKVFSALRDTGIITPQIHEKYFT